MNILQNNTTGLISFFFIVFVFTAGCEDNFKSLKERETHPYSIYGYLAYPSDVNWVRVSEVRDVLYTDENAALDANVTLEHLESGQTETLQDSLIEYEEDIYAHNFKAEMEIQPEESYLLTAERSDGQVSSVTVSLPATFPEPEIQITSHGYMNLNITGVDNLAEVTMKYDYQGEVYEFSNLQDAENTGPGEWRVEVFLSQHFTEMSRSLPPKGQAELYIGSAGPGWINFTEYDPLEAGLPDASNVDNGVGYVIGLTRKVIPINF